MNERWYDKTVAQVEEKLNTDVNTGLSLNVLHSRQKNDRMNIIYSVPHHSFESCLKKIVSDPATVLLFVIAVIAAFLEQDITAWALISLVSFNVVVSAVTYHKAYRIFEDMSKLSLPTTKVMRNGKMFLIKSEQLVKGDVIFLSAGDMVPADARLVESDNLQVLEVNLTGEIKPTEKDPLFLRFTHDVPPSKQANMLFASTIVIKGTAKAICCCTGEDTLVRKMYKTKKFGEYDDIKAVSFMTKFSKIWSLLLICIVFLIVLLMLVFDTMDNSLFEIFLTSLALAAASTGEFHLISTYVIVANGLFSAVKQNKHVNSGALIKNISKTEQLKDITCLIVNKEGAFSLRDVRVEKVFVNNTLYTFGEVHFAENARRALKFALISTGLYGAGNLIKNNLNNENIYTGEEDAIISIAQKCKVYNIGLDRQYPILEHVSKSDTSRFETTLANSAEGYTVACRGDLDSILSFCTSYAENGKVYPFDAERKAEIVSEAAKLARKSYRVVAIASKKTHYNTLQRILSCQSDLVFEGFIAIRERMLPGAAKNIADCQAAGMKVIMLCDDVGEHNRTLATALGIVKNESEIVSGATLNKMRVDMFRTNVSMYSLYENLSVFQKRKLLSYLHDEGEVVGVLARELEEIILLKESDVGFLQSTTLSGKLDKAGLDMAMAKSTNSPMVIKNAKDSKKTGSEALKFIADVIISDADRHGNGGFNAIVNSITASKVIYKNLVKFVKYMLTTNIMRLLLTIYSIISGSAFISPEQILFTGLVIDFVAMIIITFEHPDNKMILKDDSTEELVEIYKYIPWSLLSSIVWVGSIIVLHTLLKYFKIDSLFVQSTVIFIGLIFSQITVLNELLKDKSIFVESVKFNRAHLIMLVVLAVFFGITYFINPVAMLFGMVKLDWIHFGLSFIPSLLMLITYELQKLFFIKK